MDVDHAIEEMKDTLRKFTDDDELRRLNAKILKSWFDALVKEGFSEDAALRILCANPSIVKITTTP